MDDSGKHCLARADAGWRQLRRQRWRERSDRWFGAWNRDRALVANLRVIGDGAAIHVAADGTRDYLYVRDGKLFHAEQAGTVAIVETEIEPVVVPSFDRKPYFVARDASGAVHAVWQNGDHGAGGQPEVKYAVRSGVLSRSRPLRRTASHR
jgi:hypothetical protein